MLIIKFRGKRKDNGQWVYGYYNYNPFFNRGEIFTCDELRMYVYEVDPETVGQFTGEYDINKREIYAGDITEFNSPDKPKGIVVWSELMCGWRVRIVNDWSISFSMYEVIGNIYDDKEMAEEIRNA